MNVKGLRQERKTIQYLIKLKKELENHIHAVNLDYSHYLVLLGK